MKILAIRGKNLASLENFDVDLESGPLERTGIFAITGPTGAGKTTLLDALCVALFGRTPRLSNSAGVPVGTAEEDEALRVRSNDVRGLLRRGTGDGFAEVDFVGKGDRQYRARWEVHRARRSGNGKLQPAVLSLTDLESGQVVTGKKGETLDAIEDALGLSFEQFRRSALLAQNDFAAFLRADKDERSELLERMTGTDIYTKVSMAAFRRASDESKELALLQESFDVSALVDDEERRALSKRRDALRAEHKGLQDKLRASDRAARWYREHNALTDAVGKALAEEREARKASERLSESEERLQATQDALKYRTLIDAAAVCRKQADEAVDERGLAEEALRQAKARHARATEKRQDVLAELAHRRERYRKELESEIVVRAEEQAELAAWLEAHEELRHRGEPLEEFESQEPGELDELEGELAEAFDVANRQLSEILADGKNRRAVLDRLSKDAEALREASASVDRASLAEELEDHREALRNLDAMDAERAGASKWHTEQQAAISEAAAARKKAASLRAQLTASTPKLEALEAQAREASEAYDRLRLALDLSEHRASLREGEACPLCGSEEHPFGNADSAVQSVVAEQKERVDTLRKQRQALETQKAELTSAKALADEQAIRGDERARRAEEELVALRARYQSLRSHGLLHGLLQGARASDADLLSASEAKACKAQRKSLSTALTALNDKRDKAEALHIRAQEARDARDGAAKAWEAARLETEAAEARRLLAEKRLYSCQGARYRRRRARLSECESKRSLLTSKLESAATHVGPESEAAIKRADAALSKATEELAAATARLDVARTRVKTTAKTIEESDERLEDALDELDCTWSELGQRLALGEAWMKETAAKLKASGERLAEARTRLSERKERLTQLEAEGKPEMAEADAKASLEKLQECIDRCVEEGMRIAGRLEADAEARKRREDIAKKIVRSEKRVRVFRTLSDLIGSSDGKKFRVFAQSLTLDSLLEGANQHLSELAPRYRLQRVPGHDLDLQVIDHDLADDVRSVNSLSGGESFLISLALALGLSSLASRDVRVESLLVDEGFGSLDEETLEVALGVLDSLQATGRKVGLISHVPGFAERIGAQVRVTPRGGGRSTIQVHAH